MVVTYLTEYRKQRGASGGAWSRKGGAPPVTYFLKVFVLF
jgi:hypothetical protein